MVVGEKISISLIERLPGGLSTNAWLQGVELNLGRGAMKYRIARWAIVGFLVAVFWAAFTVATFPPTSERMRDVWTFVCLTCPIAVAGMHHPINLYEVLVANTVTYGFVGLLVESLRKQLHRAIDSR